MIWYGWVLWHIDTYRLFNVMSRLYIYIKHVWFTLVGFYGTSTLVGYLRSSLVYIYISNIYMIWFGLVLWHIDPCRVLMLYPVYMLCNINNSI